MLNLNNIFSAVVIACCAALVLLITFQAEKTHITTLKALAFFDYSPAEFELANYYFSDRETRDEAISYMIDAGEHGHAEAQNTLGWWYDFHPENEGNYDFEKAEYWYKKADAQGIVSSSHNLGLLYKKMGKYELVEKQLLKAAKTGWPNAQNSLGKWYFDGRNSKLGRDFNKARYWYCKAAMTGHDLALKNLATLERREGNKSQAKTIHRLYLNVISSSKPFNSEPLASSCKL